MDMPLPFAVLILKYKQTLLPQPYSAHNHII